MKNMNRLLVSLGLIFSTITFGTACASNASENTENKSSEVNKEVKTEEKAATVVSGKTIQLTKAMFIEKVFDYENQKDWKYNGTTPCIIDFYADWCGPCKMIAPTLEELAKEYDGKVIIYKVDTEKERELAGAFGIQSIPALLFVPVNGQPQMAKGALPKESFVQAINDVLLVK